MLAKKYLSEIVSIKNPFEGIYTLEFKSKGSNFKYLPGQFLHIALDESYDGSGQWPESRCFSMQSFPGQDTIRVTYAVKGRFTKSMEEKLKPGSEVWLKLPYGDLFSQPHKKENTVFIAGGTGVTPFLSLFNHSSFLEYTHPRIYLGFKSKAFNIYDEELNSMLKDRSNGPDNTKEALLNIFYQDVDGIINIDLIFKENGIGSGYFIYGPPVMIKIFKARLMELGVPKNNILTDDWE